MHNHFLEESLSSSLNIILGRGTRGSFRVLRERRENILESNEKSSSFFGESNDSVQGDEGKFLYSNGLICV